MPKLPTTGTPSDKELAEKTQWEKDECSLKFTYSEVTRLYNGVDTLQEAGEGEVR